MPIRSHIKSAKTMAMSVYTRPKHFLQKSLAKSYSRQSLASRGKSRIRLPSDRGGIVEENPNDLNLVLKKTESATQQEVHRPSPLPDIFKVCYRDSFIFAVVCPCIPHIAQWLTINVLSGRVGPTFFVRVVSFPVRAVFIFLFKNQIICLKEDNLPY